MKFHLYSINRKKSKRERETPPKNFLPIKKCQPPHHGPLTLSLPFQHPKGPKQVAWPTRDLVSPTFPTPSYTVRQGRWTHGMHATAGCLHQLYTVHYHSPRYTHFPILTYRGVGWSSPGPSTCYYPEAPTAHWCDHRMMQPLLGRFLTNLQSCSSTQVVFV